MASQQAPAKAKWHKQLRETYTFTKEHVDSLGLKMFGLFAGIFGLMLGLGCVLKMPILLGIMGFGVAFLVTLYFFGKVAEKAAYSSIHGQLGAAASVLMAMRSRQGWFTTGGVAADKAQNKAQNVVHRVVGRPGIILVGEGPRPANLLTEQRKAHARFIPDVTIHEITVGEQGISLNDLQKTVKKLPKSLRPSEVTDLRRKLDALPKTSIPMPKGPMPQGRRLPRR